MRSRFRRSSGVSRVAELDGWCKHVVRLGEGIMEDLSSYVLPDGTLNGQGLWKREPLYQGMNGRWVERFYPGPEQSYVFKPLTNRESIDREAWIYRHVLSSFPAIFPLLLASSGEGAGEDGWTIFEDLGLLRHEYSVELATEVVQQMAWWHSFPEQHWSGLNSQGPKPSIASMASDLLLKREKAASLLAELGWAWTLDEWIDDYVSGQALSSIRVLSHGDLHLGNYAKGENGRLYIIDWEHAHLNSPFWDLYHLIDMTHPMFPKSVTPAERETLLSVYVSFSIPYGRSWELETFIRDYYRFSVIFSLWMLLLIADDLKRDEAIWPKERLLVQYEETAANLVGCLSRLAQQP